MGYDRIDSMYDALSKDGAQIGTRQQFKKLMLAPGKQGYQNRLGFYNAMKQDGAQIGNSYEDFARAMGLHAVKPKAATLQPQQQPSKPQTAAQMAKSMAFGQKQQPQQPRSAFVQGLYDQDDAQRKQNIDYTSPKATQQMVTTRQNAQRQATRKAADTIVNTEKRRRNQPIVKTGTPADQSIVMTQGELEDQENREIGNYLDKVIGDEFKNAHARGLAALSAAGGPYTHGVGGADWYVGERAYQQQMDSQKQLENITANVSKQIESVFSDPKVKDKVLGAAARLNMSPEDYINQHLAPALIQKTNDQFNKTQLNRMMARGSSDYIASGILNSLTGTLLTGLTTSKNQRQMQQQADAMTEEGLNPNYRPDIFDKAVKGAVGFMADAPAFGIAGKAGTAVAGRILGNSVAQAARLANMSKLQRAVYMAKNGAVSQGVTGILYGSTNAVAQNMSTGDDNSIGTNLKLAMKGGLSEGASFATMGAIGGVVGGLGYGIGTTWREPTFRQGVTNAFKKIGYEGFKVVSEGIGMHVGGQVANLIENGKFDLSVSGTLEDVANVVALKLTHVPKLNRMHGEDGKRENFADAIIRKFGEFVTSDAEKNRMWQFSSDDKDAIMQSGGLANVKDLGGLKASYQKIMADPSVSWDAKAKYSAMVMGVMPSSRPMGDYHTFTFEKVGGDKAGYKKYINEYAADGTLLSKRSYNTADERENALYNDAILKENLRLGNGFALSVNADTSDRELQAEFLRSKGFDESKPLDYHVNRTLAAGMQDHESAIYQEFIDYAANHGETGRIVDAVAQQNGMTREQLVDAFQNKDALKRTDAEQNACVQLRRAFEGAVFKAGDAHPEQSQMEGKDVAADNNLGSEQPNPQPVVEELRNLRAAEQEVDELIRDNDVFGQNFETLKKQGLSNPQIYDWMVQNGVTEEQLEPFAHYINANARVQGMQDATAQKIEEVVSGVVQDWSYKGELNGQKMNGEQVVYVQDSEGRTLIVGSGDVAFDPTTGRAKEDVGDMLICFDPNTKELVYRKTDDVTFMQTQKPEDFANEYRQRLQMINSQPYNAAAQEQAMQDAGKPSESGKTTGTTTASMEGDTALSQSEGMGKGTENNSSVQENPIINDGKGGTDKMGNTLNSDGSIYTESVKSVSDITDEDFDTPSRSVELPPIPQNVSSAIGADGKPVIIKKNIFEKNATNHPELDAEDSRAILTNALYNPNLVGQTQPVKRPSYKVAVQTGDKNSIVVLDVYNDKKQVEIVGWRLINEKGLAKMKRQAEREGGQFLILSPNDGSAAALSALPHDSSSGGKDTNNSSNGNGNNTTLTFADGSPVPIKTDSKGNKNPDFDKMTPEQSAEVITNQFGENAEKFVDAQIKKAEEALKKAEKMKVDYSDFNGAMEQESNKRLAIEAAKKQLEQAQNIKKAMTAKKVAETVGKPIESDGVEGAYEAGNVAAEKFVKAPRLQGNHVMCQPKASLLRTM